MIDPHKTLLILVINTLAAVFLIVMLCGCGTIKEAASNYDRSVSIAYENPQVPGARFEYRIERKPGGYKK